MDTTSIINRPTIDTNAITSPGFNVQSLFSDQDRKSLNLLKADPSTNTLTQEIEDKYKMAAFVESITSNKVDANANSISMSAMMGKKNNVDTWDAIKNGWRNGRNQMDRSEIRWDEMLGGRPVNYDLPPLSELPQGDNWFESSLGGASNMLPMMIETMLSGAKYGIGTGLAAAGVAAVAGQAGPQIALPEEAITVPGAFLAFGTLGATYGGVKRSMEIEGGLMFDELIQMKGPNGERIDPQVAVAVASGVGLMNGLLEVAQIDELIKTIPGGKKLLRKGIAQSIKKTLQNKTLLKLAGKHLFSYGKTVTTETLQELAQESSNIVGGELAKYLHNSESEGKISHANAEEILSRYKDTAIQSIQSFSVLAAPGHIGGTVVDMVDNQGVSVKNKVSPGQEMKREVDIRPRIDPKTLGAEDVVAPVEGVKAPLEGKAETSEEVASLSEEEQVEVAEIEKGAQAELPSTVKPKLYIGNVTRRMKTKFAEIFGKEEGDVAPFMDGPFPTKRTEIEMTGDQAISTLVLLESSLDQRLNDNLVRTENDLARANADWGDIKELRKVLDLPVAKRPFTVTRATKQTIVVPGTTNQRIAFSVQLSKADKLTTTRIERLNAVMRKMQQASKEGYKAAAKHYRELQYLRKQAQLRKKLVQQIKATPSEGVDTFYAKAIKEIQSAIDFKATEKPQKGYKKTVGEQKAGLRRHLEQDPEFANELPPEVLDSLDQRDLESLSLSQLQQIRNETKRLSVLGKLKSKKANVARKSMLKKMVGTAVETVKATRNPRKLLRKLFGETFHETGMAERAWTLRAVRILDMLDGGQNFDGPIVRMFDGQIQDAYDSELTYVDHRQQRGLAKLKELGLSLFHFRNRRKVGNVTITVDDMCGVYAGWMNPESQLALQYGGIKMESGKNLLITEELYDEIVNTLTEEEKAWAEFVMEDYADNWSRIREALIVTENKDLGRRANYTKMRRIGVDKSNKDDVLGGFDYSDESNYRNGMVKAHDKFTKERINIPPEYQLPIDTSLTRVWEGEIRKQEHYIAMSKLLKDLNAVVNDKLFSDTVKEKFGDSIYSSLQEYLKRVAAPDYYRTFDELEGVSKALRKNTATAYLAYNLLTVLKQVPSLALYSAHSSISDLLMSAVQVAVHPKKTYDAILSHNRQIGHAQITREMEELKHTNKKAYMFIVRKVGNAGLRGIFEVDRSVRVIGENSVINKLVREGMSLEEATKKARQITLRTQPAASAKDIARLYANNETLNWFTMFTNQLNQIYNVATYDVPAAWHNKNFVEVGRSVIAMSVVAAWIWALQHKELPDEPEEVMDALAEQTINALPIVGSAILAGKRGWSAPSIAPLGAAMKTSAAAWSGDTDKIINSLFEDTALLTGSPYIGIKRIYNTAAEQDLWELIGGKD